MARLSNLMLITDILVQINARVSAIVILAGPGGGDHLGVSGWQAGLPHDTQV